MAPPSRIIWPDTLGSQYADIERRLRALETAPSLAASSVKEGAFSVLDNAGATRVRMGKDPVTGAYGVEIYDASSNLILDAVGLQQVMKIITTADASPQNQTINLDGVTNFDIAGANTSIVLTRATDVLLSYFFTVRTRAVTGGNFAYASVYTGPSFAGKVFQSGSLIFDKANPGYVNETGWCRIAALPAGTTRVAMTIFGDNGLAADVYQTHLDVYRLGA